ncbi:Clavaminate synthase-like protein [Fistulina hepatica ATCC 64428]|uniref:Clavaminate synthase-like protein n=1 Tax=Fistulina hepatica ATCC 64428 TaxID=1128425 RepID=A0A0D7ABA0_9AGAR|nr:Clavaminate synthase-like protein [Fistulina hepatica ATCC 64428]
MVEHVTLPTVDFALFGDGTSEEAKAIASKFYEACRDVGFAYLLNTGIPQDKVDLMFEWSAKFFTLPSETKLKAPHPPEGWKHRGYSGVGVEQVAHQASVFDADELAAVRKTSPDFKESFDIGTEEDPRCENVWIPEEDLPGFRKYAMSFYESCREFEMKTLLPALAIGLRLDKQFFLDYHSRGDNQLRLLHYPEVPTAELTSGEKGRIRAHTDFGTGTLLFQDDCGGLEVESPHEPGKFIPAVPMRGVIVFNIGDLLMRWSNDTLKSTFHRVRAPPPKDGDNGVCRERFSIPYFITSDRDTVVDCLPTCWGPDRPKKYEPIATGEYIDKRLNANY